jgi:hypothetical protein
MESLIEKLNKYYIRTKGKKLNATYSTLLQKSEDELTADEELIYRNRVEPNMDYFIDTMYRIFVEEGRPLDAWREAVLQDTSIINGIAKKVVVRAIRDQEMGG